MLIVSRSNVRGEAGTSSGIGFRPVVLLRRSSGGIFVRAVMPLGMLLGELEEFCSTSLKTLLLLLKHRSPRVLPLTSPSSPNASAGAALVGQREQPSPLSLRRGRSGCPPFLGGPPSKWGRRLFCQRKSPPCPGLLGHSWASAVPRVTSHVGREDLCNGRCLAQSSEEDARGAVKVRREWL